MSPATILIALVSDRQQALTVLLVLMSTPAMVRPAPFYTALSCSLSQMEAAYV